MLQSWLNLLEPDLVVAGTVLQLSPDQLKQLGIEGIIFDVDNTLVPLQQSAPDPEVAAWLEPVREQFQVWLVSNNLDTGRIRDIAQQVGIPYISRAAKPSRRALRLAIGQMNLPPAQVAIVGDRLLTDVLAGNRLGLLTVLVDPLVPKQKDPWWESLRILVTRPTPAVPSDPEQIRPDLD